MLIKFWVSFSLTIGFVTKIGLALLWNNRFKNTGGLWNAYFFPSK